MEKCLVLLKFKDILLKFHSTARSRSSPHFLLLGLLLAEAGELF